MTPEDLSAALAYPRATNPDVRACIAVCDALAAVDARRAELQKVIDEQHVVNERMAATIAAQKTALGEWWRAAGSLFAALDDEAERKALNDIDSLRTGTGWCDQPPCALEFARRDADELARGLAAMDRILRDGDHIAHWDDPPGVGLYSFHGAALDSAPTLAELVRKLGREGAK